MTLGTVVLSLSLAASVLAGPAYAQAPEHGRPAAAAGAVAVPQVNVGQRGDRLTGKRAAPVDIISPHITDSHHLDVPTWHSPYVKEVELPRWAPLHFGSLELDLSPTKHVMMLLFAAFLCMVVLIPTAVAHERHTSQTGSPKGFAAGIEAVVLYMRNEVIIPNVGPHGNAYVPFGLTLFFFILFANLLGLVPYGSTATGNISVTAMLAIVTFVVVEISGIRKQGWGYLKTIFYVPPREVPWWLWPVMVPIMTIVEIIGKFTKPFALAIRLFANMTAGHVVLLALISLIFTFGSYYIALAPVAMGVGTSLLEIFVSFLQAYIFTILSCVFIGLIRQGGH
ncbi:MAG: F0F1 ATP synthase subunit A [Gemmatimonadaceae bacterium]